MKKLYLRAVKLNYCLANTIDNYRNNLLVPLLLRISVCESSVHKKVKQYELIPRRSSTLEKIKVSITTEKKLLLSLSFSLLYRNYLGKAIRIS